MRWEFIGFELNFLALACRIACMSWTAGRLLQIALSGGKREVAGRAGVAEKLLDEEDKDDFDGEYEGVLLLKVGGSFGGLVSCD